MSDEIAFLPAHELALRIRRGELSSLELLELYLARIERYNPKVNAVIALDTERATRRARNADAALARGQSWGPLHGVPMTVKESFNLPGLATTWGFETMRDNIAQEPAVVVQRLMDAGAVVFGKTNVPVSLADWQSFNPVYGTTSNPWDLARIPGGSSGGSAAALAAGLTGLEFGSDIGASIRNPAHYCGVWGHKPTWGVVPMTGQELPGGENNDTMDLAVVGPMARSAFDLSLALDIAASPLESMGPMGRLPAQWRDRGVPPTRCRVAIIYDDPQAEVDSSVQSALHELASFLRSRGVQVVDDARPVASAESHEVYLHLLRAATGAKTSDADFAEAIGAVREVSDEDLRYPARMWRGITTTHRRWQQMDQTREKLRRQWRDFFERFDLLICPVATTPAFEHNKKGERWERMVPVNGHDQPSTDALFWAGYPTTVGLPATAVPLGLSAQGLPVGAQIIGPAFADPECLRFAQWLEREYHSFVAPPMAW